MERDRDARIERVIEIGTHHAVVETQGDLAGTMETLEPEPVYEFHPVGGILRGEDAVRRYYQNLIESFLPTGWNS